MTLLATVVPTEIDAAEFSWETGWPIVILLLGAVAAWMWALRRIWQRQPVLTWQEHPPVPWQGAEVAIAFLSFYALLIFSQLAIVRLLGVQADSVDEIPVQVLMQLCVAQAITEVAVVAGVIWFLRWHAAASWTDLGFDWRARAGPGAGVVAFFVITLPVQIVYFLVSSKETELHPMIQLAMRSRSDLWLIGVCGVLVAPLVEEFLFRVVLQGWLERRERATDEQGQLLPLPGGRVPRGTLPILVSSFFFALAHASNWPAPLPLFLLALVLGYLYHQTHRLWPSLVVHMLFNGTTFFNLWLLLEHTPAGK